jgi:hypothetical protein
VCAPPAAVIRFSGLAGVAVDSQGVVWVERDGTHDQPALDSFTGEQPNAFLADREAATGAAVEPGLAVDSEDNLYAVTAEVGEQFARVSEFAHGSCGRVKYKGGASPTGAIAVIAASNDVLVDENSKVELLSAKKDSLCEGCEEFSSPLHGDPFDRLLVAQARLLDLPIVTADAQIARYPVGTVLVS